MKSTWMNWFTIIVLVILATILFTPANSLVKIQASEIKENGLSFFSFQRVHLGLGYTDSIPMTSGDFDGDGDIDIALYKGNLILIENKIPQKNK